MIDLFICGEGRNELGDWARDPSYREQPPRPGVLQALLAELPDTEDWQVVGAVLWKSIRKYRAGLGDAERRNVLGLILKASEAGCDAVAFIRDQDNDPGRRETIEDALAEHEKDPQHLPAIGGVAIKRLESWLVALTGAGNTESMGKQAVDAKLEKLRIPPKDSAAMVAHVKHFGIRQIHRDARSLLKWLDRARAVLSPAAQSKG